MSKRTVEFYANPIGDCEGFVSQLRKSHPDMSENRNMKKWSVPETWFEFRADCLTSIRMLAANERFDCTVAEPFFDSSFFQDLEASRRDPKKRFQLLTTRYLNPLNFTAPTEQAIREQILERLMVTDRSLIERHSVEALEADDLLLRLNLVAINASVSDDLRFLDAMNYYYELLPTNWYPKSPHNWLLPSFVALYIRALTTQIN